MHPKDVNGSTTAKYAEWSELGLSIRSGDRPDAAHLLSRYLDLGTEIANASDKNAKRWIYLRMLEQLENTICDCLIAKHWRENCADHLYRPLRMLSELAENARDKQEYRRLSREAYRQCSYFLCE